MYTPQTRLCGRPAMEDDFDSLEAATSGPGVEQEPSPSPAGECWVPGASSASSSTSEETAFSPEVWLMAIVLKGLRDFFATEHEATVEHASLLFSQEIRVCVKQIREADPEMPPCCETLNEDLDHLVIIFSSGSNEARTSQSFSAKSLETALSVLENDNRMATLKKKFYELKIGRLLIAEANNYLHISAKDDCADDKISLAEKALHDKRLPHLALVADDTAATGHTGKVFNFILISDGIIVEIFGESLTNGAEALRLWSPLRSEERAPLVLSWAKLLLSKVVFCDEMMCVFLQSLVCSHLNKGQGTDMECDDEGDRQDKGPLRLEPGADWLEMSKSVDDGMFDDSKLTRFVMTFLNFVTTTCPKHIREQEGWDEIEVTLRTRVRHNIEVRSIIVDLFSNLAALQELPAASCEAIQEWKNNKAHGRVSHSFFAIGKNINDNAKKLKDANFNLVDLREDIDINIDIDEGGLETYSGSCILTSRLPKIVSGLPVLGRIAELLQGGVQLTLDDLADSLHLEAIRQDPIVKEAAALSMPQMLATVLNPSTLPSFAKGATKLFSTNSKTNVDWPCEVLLELAKELATQHGEGEFSVSMAQFKITGDETWTSSSQLWQVMGVWVGMCKIATSFEYLHARSNVEADLFRDSRIKEEVCDALIFAKTMANAVAASLRRLPAEVRQTFQDDTWIMPTGKCEAWLDVARTVAEAFATKLVVSMTKMTAHVAAEVSRFTPKWDHIIGESKMNKGLAKKHLLGWPSRAELNQYALLLFHSIADGSRLFTQWAVGDNIADHPETKESVDFADGIWTSARKALAVIAACNVLIELNGDDQGEKADSLLEKRKDVLLPLLITELEKLARSAPPVSTTAKPASRDA